MGPGCRPGFRVVSCSRGVPWVLGCTAHTGIWVLGCTAHTGIWVPGTSCLPATDQPPHTRGERLPCLGCPGAPLGQPQRPPCPLPPSASPASRPQRRLAWPRRGARAPRRVPAAMARRGGALRRAGRMFPRAGEPWVATAPCASALSRVDSPAARRWRWGLCCWVAVRCLPSCLLRYDAQMAAHMGRCTTGHGGVRWPPRPRPPWERLCGILCPGCPGD
jgi:hypothetical protein